MNGGRLPMYLTYEEYINLGGELEQSTFSQLEFEARAYVDWYTFGRLKNEKTLPDAVKTLMVYLINLIIEKHKALNLSANGIANISTNPNKEIVSQSNDGVSTTYNIQSAGEIIKSSKSEVDSAINLYLYGIENSLGRKLLYRGLYPGE